MVRHELVSVDEFLEFDEKMAGRFEYVAGGIYEMECESRAHSRIVGNVGIALHAHFSKGRCAVYISGMKVRFEIGRKSFVYSPDVVAECSPKNTPERWLEEARLIVEVLSPSTQVVDRREKRLNYPHIETLEEYVLISQGSPEVTIHRRVQGWHPVVLTAISETAELRSVQLDLPLRDIYEQVF